MKSPSQIEKHRGFSLSRRGFVGVLGAFGGVGLLKAAQPVLSQLDRERPRILLRESLQYENIGDSGRVPGTLRLIYESLPGAEITLWPWKLHESEREMLRRNFPALAIAEGDIDEHGRASTEVLRDAWERSTFFLSPSKNIKTFLEWAKTGRPFGLFGAAFDAVTDRKARPQGYTLAELEEAIDRLPSDAFDRKFGHRDVYERASFIFCRDTLSLRLLQKQKLKPPLLAFGPEGAFAMAVRDERRAEDWLRRNGLKRDDYICVVPRLRYTPYYRVENRPRADSDYALDDLNAASAETDHARLRDMMVRWVKGTGCKVVACPEMSYQIQTAKEHLIDPLPADIKRQVVWRDTYWLPDEAASIYARARAVVSIECHSPILALASGTPTLHLRQPVDTVKAQMFRDIGVPDWLFEVESTSGEQLWQALKSIHEDLPAARARVQAVMENVARLQRGMVQAIGRSVVTQTSTRG